jgi:hypothetical protein
MNIKLIFAVFLLAPLAVSAQFQKNASTISAGVSFNTSLKKVENPEVDGRPFTFDLGVGYGKFLQKNKELSFTVGTRLAKSYAFNTLPTSILVVNNLISTFYTRLDFRIYYALSKKLFWTSGFSGGYSYSKYKTENQQADFYSASKSNQLSIGYTPSLVFMATKKIGVRGNFGGAAFTFNKIENSEWDSIFDLSLHPSNLNIGLFLLLNGSESDD